jgi:S1/P1 Nuclease
LVHLVGDLHMPLHASDRGDKGGGDLKASYGRIPSSLHLIWDGYLPERSISTPPSGPAALLSELGREPVGGTVTDWARESWEVGRDFAYATAVPDPCGAVPGTPPVITEETTQRLIPIVRRQIARGGLRLARLLDEALG